MKMIKEVNTRGELDSALAYEGQIYFKLAGGLGNQLFGLSEAFNLHNRLRSNVLVDIGSIEHSIKEKPDWLEWSNSQEWFEVIRTPVTLSRNLNLIDMGNLKNDQIPESKMFTGWRFSLKCVEESGLFTRNQFPFEVQDIHPIPVALHYRAGDYAKAEGIGILRPQYYSRALTRVDSSSRISIFTDDKVAALSLVDQIKRNFTFEICHQQSAIEVLFAMSKAKILISANSTLSWWALFFSNSELRIAPKPFYLQIWNFDSEAKFEDTKYLSRFTNPVDFVLTRAKWFFRSIL